MSVYEQIERNKMKELASWGLPEDLKSKLEYYHKFITGPMRFLEVCENEYPNAVKRFVNFKMGKPLKIRWKNELKGRVYNSVQDHGMFGDTEDSSTYSDSELYSDESSYEFTRVLDDEMSDSLSSLGEFSSDEEEMSDTDHKKHEEYYLFFGKLYLMQLLSDKRRRKWERFDEDFKAYIMSLRRRLFLTFDPDEFEYYAKMFEKCFGAQLESTFTRSTEYYRLAK